MVRAIRVYVGGHATMFRTIAMLNLGVCLVALRTLAGLPAALTVVGRSLEAAAAIAFVAYAWPRVKPTGA
jgi:hypothetical protein